MQSSQKVDNMAQNSKLKAAIQEKIKRKKAFGGLKQALFQNICTWEIQGW